MACISSHSPWISTIPLKILTSKFGSYHNPLNHLNVPLCLFDIHPILKKKHGSEMHLHMLFECIRRCISKMPFILNRGVFIHLIWYFLCQYILGHFKPWVRRKILTLIYLNIVHNYEKKSYNDQNIPTIYKLFQKYKIIQSNKTYCVCLSLCLCCKTLCASTVMPSTRSN